MNMYGLKRTHLSLLFGLLVGLTTCQTDSIDEPPQILSMSIPGIPPENISIDQKERIITVVMPPTLPALTFYPAFTVSKQAQMAPYWTTGKKVISLTGYCPGNYWNGFNWEGPSPEGVAILTSVSNQQQTSAYTIQLKSGGPLRIKPVSTPIVYDATAHNNQPLHFPVENYYGSSLIEFIAVTKTGSPTPNWIGPGGGRMENCEGLLNEIGLSLTGYWVGGMEGGTPSTSLKPGLHDLDLRLADGTKLHAEGYIMIK